MNMNDVWILQCVADTPHPDETISGVKSILYLSGDSKAIKW
mgnify:CR=1 FL=1